MGRYTLFLLWLSLALVMEKKSSVAQTSHADREQEQTVSAIERLGGNVKRDASPDRNIVSIDLSSARNVDPLIGRLHVFPRLETLKLSKSDVSTAGLKDLGKLPALSRLYLDSTQIVDQDMVTIAQLRDLATLNLGGTRISDAGLARLHGLTNLRELMLIDTPITNQGIKCLAKCEHLNGLVLSGTKISDGVADELVKFHSLQVLSVDSTAITDQTMSVLAKMPHLWYLNIGKTKITSKGLREVGALTSLRGLWLYKLPVRDADLKTFAALPKLEVLDLFHTRISDKSLEYLAQMKGLKELDISVTRITLTGVDAIEKALPNTKVTSDWVRTHSAIVTRDPNQAGNPIVEMHLDLVKDTETNLLQIKGSDKLKKLAIQQTTVTPAGLECIQTLVGLESLVFMDVPLTDKDLKNLRGLQALEQLSLDCGITDSGLKYLKDLNNLHELYLFEPKVTDAGLEHLLGLQKLRRLVLARAQVTDKGVEQLKALKGLQQLALVETKVTPAGLMVIQNELPNTMVIYVPNLRDFVRGTPWLRDALRRLRATEKEKDGKRK